MLTQDTRLSDKRPQLPPGGAFYASMKLGEAAAWCMIKAISPACFRSMGAARACMGAGGGGAK